jgi:glycosyltransferase involved in cell wall biosynthesis
VIDEAPEGAVPLRVLLFGAFRGMSTTSGDVTHTEMLLRHPPPGVQYVRFDEAIRSGEVVVRGRKPRKGDGTRLDRLIFVVRLVEFALRRARLMYREPTWWVSIRPGAFDLIHQHLFPVRQVGPRTPVLTSAGYPLPLHYAAQHHWSPARLWCATALERLWNGIVRSDDPWIKNRHGQMAVYTPRFAEYLIEHGIDASRVVVAGTALPDLCAVRVAPNNRVTLAFIGHDFVRKGGNEALVAFDELLQRFPEVDCLVATSQGEAPSGLGNSDRLRVFLDPTREAVLGEILPRTDILVLPTHSDCGAPYTVLEALQFSVAVVLSDLPWLDPQLHGPAVRRISPDEDLVAVLSALVADPAARVESKEAARPLWREHFSVERLQEILRTAYDSVVRESVHSELKSGDDRR